MLILKPDPQAYLKYSAYVEDAFQFHMHIISGGRHHLSCLVHNECMCLWPGSSNSHRVPAIVVHMNTTLIPHSDGTISHIKYVMDMPVDQLHRKKFTTLPTVEKEEAVGLE